MPSARIPKLNVAEPLERAIVVAAPPSMLKVTLPVTVAVDELTETVAVVAEPKVVPLTAIEVIVVFKTWMLTRSDT